MDVDWIPISAVSQTGFDRFGFMPVNGKAEGLRQPVHAEDLASAAVAAILSQDDLPQVLNLSGGETLSYSDMVSKIFTALVNQSDYFDCLNGFCVTGQVLGEFQASGGINSEMVKRQRLDLVFEDRRPGNY